MAKAEKFTIKDSGKRASFKSGMVRDVEDGKVDYTTVFNGPMLDRWAAHLTKGAVKYPDLPNGEPNWTLAEGEQEYRRFRRSLTRHFRQYLRGDLDEDHAAAIFFNISGMEYVREKLLNAKARPNRKVSRKAVVAPVRRKTRKARQGGRRRRRSA